MDKKDRFLTIREAAEFLKVSKTSLRRWSKDGRLRCYRVGQRGERRFRETDLLNFVYNSEQPVTVQQREAKDIDQTYSSAPRPIHAPRHICCIFEDGKDRWRQIRPYLLEQIECGGRVFYAHTQDQSCVFDHFAEADLDWRALHEQGRLILMSCSDFYRQQEDCDPLWDRVNQVIESLIDENSTPLLLIGDISDSIDYFPAREKILEYEAKLNEVLENYPQVTVICQYSLKDTPAQLIFENLCLHPFVQSHDQLVSGLKTRIRLF